MLKKILLLSVATFISAQASTFTPSGDPATDLMLGASEQMMKLSNFVSTAQIQLAKEKAEVSHLQDEVARTKNGAALLSTQIIDLTDRLSKANLAGSSAATALQLDLDKAKHDFGLAQKDIHDKTAEILNLQKDLFTLTGEVSTAKSELALMERDRNDWQRKHGIVESDLITANGHLKAAVSDLHTASSKASHFESEVKRLDLELATAKSTGSSAVTSIQLALDTAKDDLRDARLEVAAREKDISVLQTQVKDLGDEVAKHKLAITRHLSTISDRENERDHWIGEHGKLDIALKAEQSSLASAQKSLSDASLEISRLASDLKSAAAGSSQAVLLQDQLVEVKKEKAKAQKDITAHLASIDALTVRLNEPHMVSAEKPHNAKRLGLTRTKSFTEVFDAADQLPGHLKTIEDLTHTSSSAQERLREIDLAVKEATKYQQQAPKDPVALIGMQAKEIEGIKLAISGAGELRLGEEFYGMPPADQIRFLIDELMSVSHEIDQNIPEQLRERSYNMTPSQKAKMIPSQQQQQSFDHHGGKQELTMDSFGEREWGEQEAPSYNHPPQQKMMSSSRHEAPSMMRKDEAVRPPKPEGTAVYWSNTIGKYQDEGKPGKSWNPESKRWE